MQSTRRLNSRGQRAAAARHTRSGRPSLSVVIPTYQRRDAVCDAVRALARTDYAGAVELIVVIDGSTDGTTQALAAIACPFPVKIIEQNLAAIDRAIAEAQRALDADSGNLYLNTHLAETMRRKLDLLRQAAALVPVS